MNEECLPQSSGFPIPVRASDLPGLVPNLYVPVFVLLSVLPVPIPLLLNQLPRFGIPHCLLSVLFLLSAFPSFSGLPGLPGVGH